MADRWTGSSRFTKSVTRELKWFWSAFANVFDRSSASRASVMRFRHVFSSSFAGALSDAAVPDEVVPAPGAAVADSIP